MVESGLCLTIDEQDLTDTKIITAMNQCVVAPEGQDFDDIENIDNIQSENTTSIDAAVLYINVQIDATTRDVLLIKKCQDKAAFK